ncbi:MAG: FmdE family protein [Desulfobacterales bacterium]|nr:FmdE family protein [Desulfobacterales bacterium]
MRPADDMSGRAVAGMIFFSETQAQDEKIVAIVETETCIADAIQVATGCTLGTGSFIFKDHGKTAFTFVSKNSDPGTG